MTDVRTPRTRSVIDRLLLAMRLDLEFYSQVSADRRATFQAFLVVVLAGVFTGLGLARRFGGFGVWAGLLAAIGGWFLWTVVLLVVARVFGCHRNGRSLLRALGFANAPAVLLILGGSPVVAGVVRLLVVCWLLATATVALQAVYAISRRRAVIVMLVGFVIYMYLGAVTGYLSRQNAESDATPSSGPSSLQPDTGTSQ